MSFGFNQIPNVPQGRTENEYGMETGLKLGIHPLKSRIESCHPLQLHEENYLLMDERMNMKLLREVQGLHAPLKLAAELKATKSVGHLPFIESSKLSFATIKGMDDVIDFADFLNPLDLYEKNMIPHVIMEQRH